jgi:cyclase
MNENIQSRSKHFILNELSDGIWAAIAVNGGSAVCNAGLVNLGGLILAFDTCLTPQAALGLRQAAIDLFGQAPQIVVNSHYHNDHIWGNQVFANDAQILSSARTRELIETEGMQELQWYSANAALRLEALRLEYQDSNDEIQNQELLLWIGEYGGVVEALPNLVVSIPNITFNKYLDIHGDKRSGRLITFENGHTGSDTVLHLPEERILFMSDLLFVDMHPYLADGDPAALQEALKQLNQLEASCYVPGHGPVGTAADVKLLIHYIDHCYETAHRLVETGETTEAGIPELAIPAEYQSWQLSRFYQSNIRFLVERLRAEKPSNH